MLLPGVRSVLGSGLHTWGEVLGQQRASVWLSGKKSESEPTRAGTAPSPKHLTAAETSETQELLRLREREKNLIEEGL